MATTYKQVSLQSLECPVCLNIFSEPKSLSCSHTYCKTCLARLLESQPDEQKLPCPVCRQVTTVPDGDVSKLQTNVPLRSLIDDIKNQSQICTNCDPDVKSSAVTYCQECGKYMCVACQKHHSQWKAFGGHEIVRMSDVSSGKASLKRRLTCRKHANEDEGCFCSTCRKYVCFRCGMLEHAHEGHRIIEAAVHEGDQRKHIAELQLRADTKRDIVNKYIDFIEEQQDSLKHKMKLINDDIDKAYAEFVQQLTQNKELLKTEVKERVGELETKLQEMKDTSRQQITHVDAVSDLVGNGMKVPLEKDALTAHDTLCEEFEDILGREDPDYEKPKYAMKIGEMIQFRRSTKTDGLIILGQFGRISNTWSLIEETQLPKKDSLSAMTATPDGRMVVGCCSSNGIEIFSAEGHLEKTALEGVSIPGFGILSDGRYVVRNMENNMSMYNSQWQKLDVEFEAPISGGSGGLTLDQNDYIHAGYEADKQIHVFSEAGGKAIKKIQCTCIPWQIFAFKSNAMLLVGANSNSVYLINESGETMHSVSKGGDIKAYPAVRHDDSVIVAWVRHTEQIVTIDHYDDELQHIETLIKDQKIQRPTRLWYYLQEYTSGEIAFCTTDNLYIFRKARAFMME